MQPSIATVDRPPRRLVATQQTLLKEAVIRARPIQLVSAVHRQAEELASLLSCNSDDQPEARLNAETIVLGSTAGTPGRSVVRQSSAPVRARHHANRPISASAN
jgi:hypothetical protein